MQEFSFMPVGKEYVRNYIEHINPRKSVGVDNISSKLLKISSEVIDKITRLIIDNFFIEKEAWPIEWKSGNITPVFKQKCDDTDKSNYRPISVLPLCQRFMKRSCMTKFITHSNHISLRICLVI